MVKKLIMAILLAIMMVSGVFAANSNVEQDYNDNGGTVIDQPEEPEQPEEQPEEPEQPIMPPVVQVSTPGSDTGFVGVSTKRTWKVVYEDEYVIVSHFRTYQVSREVCGDDVMYCNEKIYPDRIRTEYKDQIDLEVIETSL